MSRLPSLIFCTRCQEYTVHYSDPLKCIRCHQPDEVKAWEKEREAHRKWLAGRNYLELLNVLEDTRAAALYQANLMDQKLDKNRFMTKMQQEFGGNNENRYGS